SVMAGIIAHHHPPLLLGDCVDAEVKSFGEGDLVLSFVRLSSCLRDGTAHHEAAGRYPHELHADAVGISFPLLLPKQAIWQNDEADEETERAAQGISSSTRNGPDQPTPPASQRRASSFSFWTTFSKIITCCHGRCPRVVTCFTAWPAISFMTCFSAIL